MKFSYDPLQNIAYIRFQAKRTDVESVKVSDELTVDMTPDGRVYGIELLNATEQLTDDDAKVLEIINEATGQRIELPLAAEP